MSKKEVLNFSIKSHTLKGLRPTNQDTVIFAKSQDKSQLAIIADGIGSLPNSEKCSEIICKVFVDCFKNRNINNYSKWFKETLQECHCKIVEYSKQNLNNQNIGSTIAVAIVKDDKLSFFHIGDTRIYLIRGHKVKQLTQDHNYKTFLLRKKASNKELVASMYK
ncbi:protein phosphatase 2C domain-containing protein [bacterium]|nr:protein phosphatase 2C domain-containing protein [bacterium]